jgi:glucose/arabinose dehydrogenase
MGEGRGGLELVSLSHLCAVHPRRRRRIFQGVPLCGIVLLLGVGGVAQRTPAASVTGPTDRVNVSLVDFRIRLSRTTIATARVTFKVTNKGSVGHDLVLAGRGRTRILRKGQSQTITVSLANNRIYRLYCSVPGHVALGMTTTIRVGKAKAPIPLPKTKPRTGPSGTLLLTPIVTGLGQLTDVAAPPGDAERVLVARRDGVISLVHNGALVDRPFLDLRNRVRTQGEGGLLSFALAPDYSTSGLLYVDYTDLGGNVRVVEYRRSTSDPDVVDPYSARELLRIIEPTGDHIGGMLQFDPGGDLYVAVGDGGADPPRIPVGVSGQTLDDLLGSILRIDPHQKDPYAIPSGNPFVSTAGARPEIVAYGLRNPWRFWIDTKTNAMLIADVGESAIEEIDRLPLNQLGPNFGWPCREGTATPDTPLTSGCDAAQLVPPLYEYRHSSTRCSIIGGVVSHDLRVPALDGLYLWSDLCDSQIYAIDPAATSITEIPLGVGASGPTSFGTDALGRTYLTTENGVLYRLDPATNTQAARLRQPNRKVVPRAFAER